MRFHKAMKLLEEGKKVRCSKWEDGQYICLDENYNIIDNEGNIVHELSTILCWEIYDDRMEIDADIKELYKAMCVIETRYESGENVICDIVDELIGTTIFDRFMEILDIMNEEFKLDN